VLIFLSAGVAWFGATSSPPSSSTISLCRFLLSESCGLTEDMAAVLAPSPSPSSETGVVNAADREIGVTGLARGKTGSGTAGSGTGKRGGLLGVLCTGASECSVSIWRPIQSSRILAGQIGQSTTWLFRFLAVLGLLGGERTTVEPPSRYLSMIQKEREEEEEEEEERREGNTIVSGQERNNGHFGISFITACKIIGEMKHRGDKVRPVFREETNADFGGLNGDLDWPH